MSRQIRFIIITLLVITYIKGYGQDYTLTVVPTSPNDQLIGNRLSTVLEDKDGFIWMLTQSGVARYDGHHYLWFNKTNSKLRDIPKIKQIAEDKEGYIWLNLNNKIDLIHRSTFEVVHFEEKFKEFSNSEFIFRKISQGEDGSILITIIHDEKPLSYLYHPETGFKKLDFIKNKKLFNVVIKRDYLWLETKEKWIKHDIETGKKLAEFKIGKPYTNIHIVLEQETGDYFLGTTDKEGVIFEASEEGIKELIRFPYNYDKELSKNDKVLYDNKNQTFITFIRRQLSVVDFEQQKLIPVKPFSKDVIQPFSKIFHVDNQGVFWGIIGSEKGAINLGKINSSKFKSYLTNHSIRGLWVNKDFIFTNKFTVPLANPENYTISLLDKNISVESNIKDELWQSSTIGIVNAYSNNDSIRPPIVFANQITTKQKTSLWSILRDKEGIWWGGMSGVRGLVSSSKIHRDSLNIYDQYNEFEELRNSITLHLVEDGKYIWAASNTGIHLIDKKKGVIQRYTSTSEKEYQLPLDNAHFIYKDENNTYWIATNANGLVRFELNEKMQVTNYKTYTTEDGMSSNVLYTIIEDKKERLWISTFNGLTCFDKKNEQIQVFLESDGLPETEFNRISHSTAPDGRIYFGSINGIISFHPDEIIKSDNYIRPLTITKFEKYENNGETLVDKTLELKETKRIRLLPSDRFTRLSVSLLDYFNTQQVRYAYKIEGLFDEFQLMDGNTIELGGLSYGQYKIVIRGQGANRRFSTEELVIPLIVVRPFYLKAWFLLLVAIIVVISGLQAYFWRIRRLEERKKELEILVKERTSKIEQQSLVLQERTTKIEQQAIQLKELDELKSKFFANISHELRTPLTLILAPLSNLFKIKNLSNTEHTQIMLMQQNGQKLLKRINELLDLSRLDANKLEVKEQPTFLYPFFKTLLSTFESTTNIKDIQLLFDFQLNENLQALIDDDKVEKIVSNYLGNALKFTPKNGVITLKIEKQKNRLQISVKDTGLGIPSDELNRIFDRFYQSKNNQQQGTGIGLSLCQELAKVLKGRVWVISEVGEGSTFYLELPLIETFAIKEKEEEEEEVKIEEVEELAPIVPSISTDKDVLLPNILVVEDNPDLRTFLTLILKDQYNVTAAENGKEALEWLMKDSNQPSLIISDIMMPVMDGIELLSQIKSSDRLCHIPVIMLTARKSLEVKLEALRIGVDDYLTKPFTNEELIARVTNLIINSQSRLSAPPEETPKETPKISAVDLKWIQEVEQIFIKHIENPKFTMNDLSTILNISSTHVRRKIKQITGLSPKQYERSIKLAKARKLLKSGEFRTVSEVLYRLGFENHYYFSKIYKKAYGIMPTEELK